MRTIRFRPSILLFVLAIVACGGSPPTDEIAAAEEAIARADLAERCAPEEYLAAQRLLEQARQANEEGDYERALTLAESARQQAERARLMAQANADDCLEPEVEEDDSSSTTVVMEDVDYELTPVYFGFDAYSLSREARSTVQRHVNYLMSNNYRVTVEGHCDHHGTDQYNLALGEARARTVAQYMVTLGVDAHRLSTISYGEFRPASDTDPALNRRAEFRLRR